MSRTITDRLLPESWPLHRIGKELGKATHVLVSASAAGKFPPVFPIGVVWHVRADLMLEWVNRQHAGDGALTPAQLDRIRQAGRNPAKARRARP